MRTLFTFIVPTAPCSTILFSNIGHILRKTKCVRVLQRLSTVALPMFKLFSSMVIFAVKLLLLPMFVIDCTRAYKGIALL